MRLAILDRGHGLSTKALFALIRAFSGRPVLDVIKLVRYRADFYGGPMSMVTHEAMRGPSTWSVGDRELMGALVAMTSACDWCTQAHAAVAKGAYRDETRVSAVLSDLETAPIEESLRGTLRILAKLTREHAVDADDMRAALAAGVSREQIEDALAVCFALNVIGRLADAFGFARASPEAFDAGAKYLLARGYR
jgi:AhpD family alkylhydroperoxidase